MVASLKLEQTKDKIVQAALRLFCERGYAAVGTQEICAAAGVLKGSLYHFFPSKLDVALAALEYYGEGVRTHFETVARSAGSAEQRLLRVFENVRHQAESDQQAGGVVYGCLHGNLALELSAREPRAREALEAVSASWCAALAPVFEELERSGVVAPGQGASAAKAALAYLHGVVLMAKTANEPALITQLGGRVFGLFGKTGVRRRATKSREGRPSERRGD